MIITGADIETTGLEQEKGHRIIEICMRAYDLSTRKLKYSLVERIHPQRSIQQKAQEVHGISIEDLAGCPHWEEIAPKVAAMMKASDLLIAHNMAFDGPFIALELMRIGMTVPRVDSFCTMENGRWATPLGKKPSLKELCFSVGVDYDPTKAHSAAYDVDVMMDCFFKGLDLGFFKVEAEEAEEAA